VLIAQAIFLLECRDTGTTDHRIPRIGYAGMG